MVKIENNMLVLDSTFSKDDVKAINEYIESSKRQEIERIVEALEAEQKKSRLNFIQYTKLLEILGYQGDAS